MRSESGYLCYGLEKDIHVRRVLTEGQSVSNSIAAIAFTHLGTLTILNEFSCGVGVYRVVIARSVRDCTVPRQNPRFIKVRLQYSMSLL